MEGAVKCDSVTERRISRLLAGPLKEFLRNSFVPEKNNQAFIGNRCGWPLKASPPTVCIHRSNLNLLCPTHHRRFSCASHKAITRTFYWWCKVFPRGEILLGLHFMARNEHGRRIIEVIYQAELIADCRALAEPWGRQQQFCIFLLPPFLPSSSSSWQHINYDWLGSSEATELPTIAAKLLWRNVSQSQARISSLMLYSNYDDFLLRLFRNVATCRARLENPHIRRIMSSHLTFSLRNLRSYFCE